MSNEELKVKYNEMHKQGASAWFGDGREERETILKMGEPWWGLKVLEIGCGEGELIGMMNKRAAHGTGIDYSEVAISKAEANLGNIKFILIHGNYREISNEFDRIVMQGVLEHLDDPFGELQWMIEHFKPKTVITSSPCFLNPRGIVWMTLDMLGAVMSKTDLHFLHPWEFEAFCENHGYELKMQDCDYLWGNGQDMITDLAKRIPLALKDGNLPQKDLFLFLNWLNQFPCEGKGATMVYKITVR